VRKRKVNYPVAKTATKGARNPLVPGDPRGNRTPATTIDMTALEGRSDLSVGDRVRIGGAGLYAGELATVTALVMGVIPAATVRTDENRTRRVRAIDIERVHPER
jgi:hypothetical protein